MSWSDDYLKYKELIPEFRQKIKEVYLIDPDKYDKVDLDKAAEDDWTVLRYLKWHDGNVSKSVKQLKVSLRWRHEFGVNKRSETDIPEELFKVGGCFVYGVDYLDRPVLYMRVKVHKKLPRLDVISKQFLINTINKVDSEVGAQGFVLLLDMTGFGLRYLDVPFIIFFINAIMNYFPYGVRQVYLYNLSRFVRPAWTIIKPFVGALEHLIKFVNDNEIFDVVSAENLPLYLGGLADIDFTTAPEGCKSVKEMVSEYGFTDNEVFKYLEIFKPEMVEAQKLVGRKMSARSP